MKNSTLLTGEQIIDWINSFPNDNKYNQDENITEWIRDNEIKKESFYKLKHFHPGRNWYFRTNPDDTIIHEIENGVPETIIFDADELEKYFEKFDTQFCYIWDGFVFFTNDLNDFLNSDQNLFDHQLDTIRYILRLEYENTIKDFMLKLGWDKANFKELSLLE